MREVTEADFRMPEFKDAKPEDYEFRADGKIVRKDRWERGIRAIAAILNMAHREFEIEDIIKGVEKMKNPPIRAEKPWDTATVGRAGNAIEVRLGQGLEGCTFLLPQQLACEVARSILDIARIIERQNLLP